MGGVAKMPAAALWLLLGVVVALWVAATPAHAFRRKTANHYDFIVSRSIDLVSTCCELISHLFTACIDLSSTCLLPCYFLVLHLSIGDGR